MSTRQFFFSAWEWDLPVLLLCASLLLAYLGLYGIQRRLKFFVSGLFALVLALLSPLDALAQGYLFSAHMTQHLLLLLVVPALLLLGLPPGRTKGYYPTILRRPLLGWLSGVGAMWIWHEPALCNAATESSLVHAVQSGSLLVLGTAFWWQILAPRQSDRLQPPAAILYLFGACLACSLLGVMLTLSPVTLCPAYAIVRNDPLYRMVHATWSFTTERDQQVGGLLMWVPMCLVYLGAIFAQLARWFAQPPAPLQPSLRTASGPGSSDGTLDTRGAK